jgi:hypothetical protein
MCNDAEKIACTMLHDVVRSLGTQVEYPKLVNWIRSIVINPDYMETVPSPSPNYYASLIESRQWQTYHRLFDNAVYDLAFAVVAYRQRNRENDYTVSIGDGLQIDSSLTASIVDYHNAMLRACGMLPRRD